jgi:hypothetical protein
VHRLVVAACCCALVLAGCSSGGKKQAAPPAAGPTTTAAPAPAATSTTTAGPSTTTTTLELPTTSLPCAPVPIPKTPVTSPIAGASVLLTKVTEINDACVDHVVFDFTAKSSNPPGYSITYGTPPFTSAGSGKPVPVRGTGFIVVTVKPGYGFDFEAGKPSYTGPLDVPTPTANHVQDVAEIGDFEGTLTWVIGTRGKRPFTVEATGTPRHQLVVSVS